MVDSLNQKLEVYLSVGTFLHNQTHLLVESKKGPVVTAKDHVHNIHQIYKQEQHRTEKAATTAVDIFARLLDDLKFSDVQKRKLPAVSRECKPKAVGFTTDEKPKQAPILKNEKTEAEEHKEKGINLMHSGECEKAIEEYNKAIDLNPDSSIYFYERGLANSTILSRHELCIEDMQRAIQLDTTSGELYCRLGTEYNRIGMLPQAMLAFKKAIICDRTNYFYEFCRADIEKRLLEEQTEGDKPVSPAGTTISPESESEEDENDPDTVTAAQELLQDPGVCHIVSAMFETTCQENSVIFVFLDIKDLDPSSFQNVYNYPLEHILEEYPEAEKQKKEEDEEDN